MFKDYYAILEITFPSNEKEIKSAYRKQSLKWHPDKNTGHNTEEEMKAVNEAYYVLSKPTSKQRYDTEYILFKKHERTKQNAYSYQSTKAAPRRNHHQSTYSRWEYDYDIEDDNLREDINDARKSAEEFVKNFIVSLKNNTQIAAKGAWNGALPYITGGLVVMAFIFIVQTCS